MPPGKRVLISGTSRMKRNNRKSGEDLILSSIVLAGNALRMTDIANATGLSKSNVKYWLPRMIASGILLSSELDGTILYEPQPLVTCSELQEHLEQIYADILENHDEFFVTDQADCPAEDVLRNNILKSLMLFSTRVRDLKAE